MRSTVESMRSHGVDRVVGSDEAFFVEPVPGEPASYSRSQIRRPSMPRPENQCAWLAELRGSSDSAMDVLIRDVPEDAAQQNEVCRRCFRIGGCNSCVSAPDVDASQSRACDVLNGSLHKSRVRLDEGRLHAGGICPVLQDLEHVSTISGTRAHHRHAAWSRCVQPVLDQPLNDSKAVRQQGRWVVVVRVPGVPVPLRAHATIPPRVAECATPGSCPLARG